VSLDANRRHGAVKHSVCLMKVMPLLTVAKAFNVHNRV